jgi:hypothetical protein
VRTTLSNHIVSLILRSSCLAYLKYLHMCLHDKKESKIELAFKDLFEFLDEAVLPEEISPVRR